MKKRAHSRGRRGWGRKIRRYVPKRVPIEVLVGAATIPFTPARSGWANMVECAKDGNFNGIMDNLKMGFLGMDAYGGIDFIKAINPLEMDTARYTKTLLIAGIIGSIRAKLTGKYTTPLFKKIPMIGRWIK